jgi:t-SNARE complex subunit (syntaxin)
MLKQKESNERAKANMSNSTFEMIETQNEDLNNQVQIQMENDVNLIQLQEREAALRKLENDIVDVNTIFKDLAVMVHEQGEIIDSIESNVEAARVTVNTATSSLQSAVKNQKSVRKKKVIFAGIIILVICILVLIIFISLKPWTG